MSYANQDPVWWQEFCVGDWSARIWNNLPASLRDLKLQKAVEDSSDWLCFCALQILLLTYLLVTWNSLPVNVVTATSLTSFKRKRLIKCKTQILHVFCIYEIYGCILWVYLLYVLWAIVIAVFPAFSSCMMRFLASANKVDLIEIEFCNLQHCL